MDCYCDYDPPSVWSETNIKAARKQHKCEECGRTIEAGEPYNYVWGIWDGYDQTFKTCQNCKALRDFVTISTPCYCWAHGDSFEGLKEHLWECHKRAPDEMSGVMFRAQRMIVAIKKAGGNVSWSW